MGQAQDVSDEADRQTGVQGVARRQFVPGASEGWSIADAVGVRVERGEPADGDGVESLSRNVDAGVAGRASGTGASNERDRSEVSE